VCDALRLDLAPIQRARLEEQLTALIPELLARLEPLEAAARAREAVAEEALEEVRYELRLARLMQASVSAGAGDGSCVFVGPADMVAELVLACVRGAVATLDQLLRDDEPDPPASPRLERAAAAAAAWIRTFRDCRAVERFSFDPQVDPSVRW
jgi:hypothetical protein